MRTKCESYFFHSFNILFAFFKKVGNFTLKGILTININMYTNVSVDMYSEKIKIYLIIYTPIVLFITIIWIAFMLLIPVPAYSFAWK